MADSTPTKQVPVQILNSAREPSPGTATIITRSSKEAFWAGGKRSAKLVAILVVAMLPFGFMEPFLFMIWGSIALVVLIFGLGPFLHLIFWGERTSFTEVQGSCPYCKDPGPLKPYLDTRFEKEVTVLCGQCGQTSRVQQSND